MAVRAGRRIASPVIVGRAEEGRLLDETLAEAVAGRLRIVVVGGEAGVGKTRLLDEFAARARAAGTRVLAGSCLPAGDAIPYLPFVEALRSLVREAAPAQAGGVVARARIQLNRLMPGADRAVHPGPGVPGDVDATGLDRLQLHEDLLALIEQLAADRPTAIVLEDVQWADVETLRLIGYVARNLRQGRVLLVLSARTDEPGGSASPQMGLLVELERLPSVERIELAPLSRHDTARQIEEIAGHGVSPERIDAIHRLGGGNPFYTEELLATRATDLASAGALSPRLRDVLAARVAALPREALGVLRVAALTGRVLDERILARASGMESKAVATGLQAAIDEHILVPIEGDRGYRFRHELLRRAVGAGLLPGERAALHAGLAAALADSRAVAPGPGEIAYHWDRAGEAALAVPAHLEAATAADRSHAFAAASGHYERALALWEAVPDVAARTGIDRGHLALRAADAAARGGNHARAIELARSIVAGEAASPGSEVARLAHAQLRWYLWESGEYDLALAESAALLEGSRSVGVLRTRPTVLAQHAGLLMLLNRMDVARREAATALRWARKLGAVEEAALALGVLGWCEAQAGRHDTAIEHVRAAWAIAKERADPSGRALAARELAAVLEAGGRTDEALEVADDAAADAGRHGVGRTVGAMLDAIAARAEYQLGRWDEADRRVDAALERRAVGPGRTGLLVVRALVAIGRGEFARGEEALEDATRAAGTAADAEHAAWQLCAVAELALWRDDPGRAFEALGQRIDGYATGAREERQGLPWPVRDSSAPRMLALAARAAADVSLRSAAAATPLDSDTSARTEAIRSTVASARRLAPGAAADLATARAELSRGGATAAGGEVTAWTAAVAPAAPARPYAEAYARWRLASAMLGAGRPREHAGPEILAAHEIATRLRARPLLREIELLARRARFPVGPREDAVAPEPPPGAAFGLTERERTVLGLVAAGLSNREIGERLFISPKTASVHVSSILGKLGVESRLNAATMAQRLGLLTDDADEPDGSGR